MEAGSSELTEPSQGNKMEDTVTLARQEREKQGPWEAEISYGGEADLHRHFSRCDKNPGHQKFIPVDQFNEEHLPPGHHKYLVDLVRAMSVITARLSVTYVSDSRPETAPSGNKPFPCYKNKSRSMMRTGTGWVCKVTLFPDKYDNSYTTCQCKECVIFPTPKKQFAHIHIQTAAHVVYDDLEAAHTTCHLFFDKGGTPHACSGVVTLSGMSVVERELVKDWCVMKYVTHDLDLAAKLYNMVDRYKRICGAVMSTSLMPGKSPVGPTEPDLDPLETLIIIVSHPHGCSKQVSVGFYTDSEKIQGGWTKLTYTASTCPGSSGALVFVLEREWIGILNGRVHSGGNSDGGQQLNFSGYGYNGVQRQVDAQGKAFPTRPWKHPLAFRRL